MSEKKKILCIFGTRPEVIKMAPVIHALRVEPNFEVSVLCSGQHRELLVPLIDWFELVVDADLGVMTENQTLTGLSARLLTAFEKRFASSRPDLVLAQGDTTTVLCAALSCFYLRIPFGHVEAGLRTFDVHNPYPEEFNRAAVTRVASLHFCPTARALQNTIAEHVDTSTAQVTGNTVIDALQFTIAKLAKHPRRRFNHDILVTAHRRENFGAPLADICKALIQLCREFPNLSVLYPVHPNPHVRAITQELLGGHANIALTEPLDYPDLIAALKQSKLVLTDSGGIQEEAPALGKPVLVLRKVTERPEAVETGVARVVGTCRAAIVSETRRLLVDVDHYAEMARGGSPYGDGRAAARIGEIIGRYLGGVAVCGF